ncbi:MAG: ATP-binding cassette domain-containing protein [Clostridiaceae bacterium]|nr:ATP-binding cassette domain-containing protein [Eubacteriales bacterium]
MIELKNVVCSYEGKTVLDGLSLSLPETGAVAVTGPSGTGKTTLLRLLAGLVSPASGGVEGLEGKRVSMVFQEDRLLPWRSALENVSLFCGNEALARETLRGLELGDAFEKRPGELSGGMRRRVALARALCFGGDILLLDEPFKGLDDALKLRVAEAIRGVFPLTVLATHDMDEAQMLRCTERVEL